MGLGEACGFIVVLLAAAAASVSGQLVVNESCPRLDVVHNFNVSRYLGKWYEYEKINFTWSKGVCITAEYSVGPAGEVVVHNSEYDPRTGAKNEAFGSARLNSTSGEAKLSVSFPVSGNISSPYWVISTDYDSYSVVWSCLDVGVFSLQFSWVLTRQKTPSTATLREVDLVLQAAGLNTLPYLLTRQNCSNN